MMLKVIKNIVLQDRLTKIRSKGVDGTTFKASLREMCMFLAYEFQSTMDIHEVKVKTSLVRISLSSLQIGMCKPCN